MRQPTLKPLNNPDVTMLRALVSQYGACSVAKALANVTWDSWDYGPAVLHATVTGTKIVSNNYDYLAKGIEKAIADYVNAGGQ